MKSPAAYALFLGLPCVCILFIIPNLRFSTAPPPEEVKAAGPSSGAATSKELQELKTQLKEAQASVQGLKAQLAATSSGGGVGGGRQPILPTEDEIQQWERIALNFSRAGNTAKYGGEIRPAYPIHLYRKVIQENHKQVCPEWKRFGDRGDGGWVVCMTPAVVNKKCIAYSFGVGADYSFEKAISKYCEVHSFDPTPHIVKMMNGIAHKITWKFHPWGLDSYPHNGTFQMYTTGDKPVPARFESLPSVMKVLGHTKVDIVKIDVEGYEVYMWHQLFDPAIGMEQLLFELHPLTRTFTSDAEKVAHGIDASRFFDWTDWLVMLTAAFRNGFKPFFAEEGRYNHAGGLMEFSFMRRWKN